MSFTEEQETGKEQKPSEKKNGVLVCLNISKCVFIHVSVSRWEHSQVLFIYSVLCSGCWHRLKVKCRILIKVEYGNIVSHSLFCH